MSESAFAQYVLSSIRNELNLLKTHNYLQPHAYDEILRLLPSNIGMSAMSGGVYPSVSNNNGPPSFNHGAISSPQSNNSIPPAGVLPPPAYNENKLGTAEALYDYTGGNLNTDLSFCRGDIIQLTELVNDDWWKGSLNGKTGIFPRTYVKRNESFVRENVSSPPPPHQQRDSYDYSPVPPKQDSYNYPPRNNAYASPPQQNPYGAPPPMQNNYTPQQQSYQPPPQQMTSYAAPPMASSSSAPAVVEQPHEESKMAGFGKKLAGNVANAATWGFGATLGSDVAHKIF